ncbi:MAG: hypothetical protein IPH59_01640 [bacterium]|nr:hypothetical protein [bacterium]
MHIRETLYLIALSVVLLLLTPITSVFGLAPEASDRYTITDHISGQITDYSIVVANDTVGKVGLYSIKFTLVGDSLRSGSKIELDFPAGYSLEQIDSMRYSDLDALTEDFTITEFEVSGRHLSITLDSMEFLPPMGTRVMIDIYSVTNPTLAESYQVLLTLLTDESQLLALPILSDPLFIQHDAISTFVLTPEGIQQLRAGTILHFQVETSDQFGNLVGVPDAAVTWGVIGVPNPAGIVEDGSFQAQHTGVSRVFANYGGFADTSGLVYVLPGAFAYFTLTGGADTAIAGASWTTGADDVVVRAHDLFGNVNYEFLGQVYFRSSDPLAQLPYTQAAPYTFTAGDQGVKTISGSQFRYFTAGRQDLSLVMNGQVQRSLFPIAILPAGVNSYTLEMASITTAGNDVNLAISNAVDAYNNSISGTATITLAGGGAAPSGALPSTPSFTVINGSGSGTMRLLKSGNQAVTITLNGQITQRTIGVVPAPANRFKFELDAVQAVNRAFFGNALLTALDPYGNIDTEFDAFEDTVRITSSGAGTVFNGVIGTSSGFVNGLCDLKDFGTGYNGNEPSVVFTARSKSGITGTSQAIGFSLLKISSGQLAQSTRYIGEQFTFALTISNFGAQPASVSAIRLYGNGSRLQPVQISPGLSFSIPAQSSQEFTITGAVPSLPNQVLSLDAVFIGQISSGVVGDSATALAQLTILPTDGISVLAGTILPQQVSTGHGYQFVLRVRNDSDDDLLLSGSSLLSIPIEGASTLTATLTSPLVVPGDGGEVLLPFEPLTIPEVEPQVASGATVRLVGTLGTATFDQVFAAGGDITIETRPVVTYRTGTLSPTTVYRGAEAEFSVGVNNSGTAVLELEVSTAELTIFAGERQLLTRLNAEQMRLGGGDSTLVFRPVFVPVDFPLQNDSITVSLRGTANGQEEMFTLRIPGNAVAIPFGAAARLVEVSADAPNMPNVNVGQAFSLFATIRNTGDEDLKDIKIQLSSNGSSLFEAQQVIEQLEIGRDTTIEFEIEASFTPNASEVFSVQIVEAEGAESGLAALIQPPLGNSNRAIVIQSPASLDIDARIWSPVSAQDGVVGLGESFEITSIVNNLAQSVASTGEVSLSIVSGDFSLNSAGTQLMTIGVRNFWDIMAPADEDTALIVVSISTTPTELNSGLLAKVQDRADTIQIISTVSQVGITVDFQAAPAQLLSAGGEYEVITLDFRIFNAAANPYVNFIEFELRDRSNSVVAPSTIIASANLLYNGQNNIGAVINGDAMRFNLGEELGMPTSGKITVEIAEQPGLSDFTLYIDSLSLSASYQTAVGPRPVPITASFAQKLVIEQKFTLVPSNLTESFFAFPNPFSPLHESSTIVYNLGSAKPAKLTIYTLAGNEVLVREIPAPSSLSEPIQILWDGRNNDGQIVLNGVYIAVLAVDGEGEIRTKIAVVK